MPGGISPAVAAAGPAIGPPPAGSPPLLSDPGPDGLAARREVAATSTADPETLAYLARWDDIRREVAAHPNNPVRPARRFGRFGQIGRLP